MNPNEDTGGTVDDGGADVDTTDILDPLVVDELPPDLDKETGGNGVTVQLPGPGKHPNWALCPAIKLLQTVHLFTMLSYCFSIICTIAPADYVH